MKDTDHRLDELTRLAQALAAAPDGNARLQVAVDAAVSLVRGCDHAGLTVNEQGGLVTRVSSDGVVESADTLQHELQEGPGLDLGRGQDTLVIEDLSLESRWPLWTKRVHRDLGVGSMMSLLVHADDQSHGALNLYARSGNSFDGDDLAVARVLAGHLTVVLRAEREIRQLGLALHSRNIIGQAQGLVMAHLDVSASQAFDYLRRLSSTSNRKVVEIASDIASTRLLPELD